MDTKEMKGILSSSVDIFNLLANLYYICSTEFVHIDSLVYFRHRREFLEHYMMFKESVWKNGGDIFHADFNELKELLKIIISDNGDIFLIKVWAYLKAIDWAVGDDSIHLPLLENIYCRSSFESDPKRYQLLFKPKNLIFDSIKDESPDGTLKIGIDIGQRIEDRLDKLIFYEEHPSRKIQIKRIDPLVDGLLVAQGKNLTFAVSPIGCTFNYLFDSFRTPDAPNEVYFAHREIENQKTIAEKISKLLEKCRDENVGIVVFPELSINSYLRGHISQWLYKYNTDQKIILVIAGSYHFPIEGMKDEFENIAFVYRYDGEKLWEQKKMHRFQMNKKDIEHLMNPEVSKGFKEFKRIFRAGDKKAGEKINTSNTLKIIDSSIGRMAVCICLDYFVKENQKLLVDPHVNLIFVPAMSSSLIRMERADFDMGTYGPASVFCANSCWIVSGGDITEVKRKLNESMKKNPNIGLLSYIYAPKLGGMWELDCNGESCDQCEPVIFKISEKK